jgi:hypothetical protein
VRADGGDAEPLALAPASDSYKPLTLPDLADLEACGDREGESSLIVGSAIHFICRTEFVRLRVVKVDRVLDWFRLGHIP